MAEDEIKTEIEEIKKDVNKLKKENSRKKCDTNCHILLFLLIVVLCVLGIGFFIVGVIKLSPKSEYAYYEESTPNIKEIQNHKIDTTDKKGDDIFIVRKYITFQFVFIIGIFVLLIVVYICMAVIYCCELKYCREKENIKSHKQAFKKLLKSYQSLFKEEDDDEQKTSEQP